MSGICPYFSVLNPNQDTCAIYACGGFELSVSVCDSYTGDTYLRLVDANGNELMRNDDYCDAGSAFTYSIPSSYACGTYYIIEGCYKYSACSGEVKYALSTKGN